VPDPLSREETWIGVAYLLISLLAAVVHLPAFLALSEQSIYLKVAWRYLVLLVLSLPLLAYDLLTTTGDIGVMIARNFSSIFFLSVANAIHVYLIYHSVQMTFVAHTLLLGSIGSTFGAVWKIISGQPYTRLEYLGIAANVFGAYLCSCEGGPLPRICESPSSRQQYLDGQPIGASGISSIRGLSH
jgi:hypothetical protein